MATYFKITNSGIESAQQPNATSKLFFKDELVFDDIGLVIRLYSSIKNAYDIGEHNLLNYDLPPPFDKFLLPSPSYLCFNENVQHVSQVKKILRVLEISASAYLPSTTYTERSGKRHPTTDDAMEVHEGEEDGGPDDHDGAGGDEEDAAVLEESDEDEYDEFCESGEDEDEDIAEDEDASASFAANDVSSLPEL